MGCLFHPRSLAPEGGAPAYVDVTSIAGWRGELTYPSSSGWHLVQGAFVLLPKRTTELGTPKYDLVGKVHMSEQPVSHRNEGTVMQRDCWRKPQAPHRLG